jgi:uncharacterized DUF497 family protein
MMAEPRGIFSFIRAFRGRGVSRRSRPSIRKGCIAAARGRRRSSDGRIRTPTVVAPPWTADQRRAGGSRLKLFSEETAAEKYMAQLQQKCGSCLPGPRCCRWSPAAAKCVAITTYPDPRDEAKSRRNLSERGFGFDYAARIFLNPTLEKQDDRRDCGEVRMQAIGQVGEHVLFVVYTDRNARHIISAWLASRKERKS